MKVAQIEHDGGTCIGVDLNGRWIDYSKAEAAMVLLERGVTMEPTSNLGALIQSGAFDVEKMKATIQFVEKYNLQDKLEVHKKFALRAPIARPPKIVALGLNYALHAAEGNYQVPKEPIIFSKAGSSVIGPQETVRIPKGLGRIDHEVELAVIIGKKATEVKRKNAYNFVAGYTIANDVSARDLQTKDIEQKHPWFRSKSFDTFTPLGPWIVTVDEIDPPIHLDIECQVNGKVRQKANTRDLIFDIPTQIEFITRYITLEPGDVISTGTPGGIGPITNGDVMVCRIDRIGELTNPVRYR